MGELREVEDEACILCDDDTRKPRSVGFTNSHGQKQFKPVCNSCAQWVSFALLNGSFGESAALMARGE